MKSRHPVRSIGVAVVALASLALLAACGGQSTPTASAPPSTAVSVNSGTFTSPSQNLGNGTVKTYVTTDEGGIPVEVGLRLSESALDGLPENTPPTDMLMLDLPDQAAATAFDHVMMNWNPQGHDPVVLFGKPHFDFHFDMADMATLQSIDPSDPDYAMKADHLPDAKYVPQDYVVPPGGSAAEQAVPGMGVHLIDSSDTSFAGSAKVVKNESSLALAGRDQRAYRAWCSLHSATTAHLTCRYALRVKVSIPRRSEWRRSAKQTAGPCVSLLGNRKLTTACLVGLGRSPG
jgi:hypothetical protein